MSGFPKERENDDGAHCGSSVWRVGDRELHFQAGLELFTLACSCPSDPMSWDSPAPGTTARRRQSSGLPGSRAAATSSVRSPRCKIGTCSRAACPSPSV